jgi:hypothetical protein
MLQLTAQKVGREAAAAAAAAAAVALAPGTSSVLAGVLVEEPVGVAPSFDVKALSGIDVYDETNQDPAKSRAVESSLWEVTLLKSHYCPQVCSMCVHIMCLCVCELVRA